MKLKNHSNLPNQSAFSFGAFCHKTALNNLTSQHRFLLHARMQWILIQSGHLIQIS